MRKPKQYAVSEPGDLVEVDTLDVRPVPGVVFKQFHPALRRGRAGTSFRRRALDRLGLKPNSSIPCRICMPFPIFALQVDGGSEFAAEFEQACQQRGLHLFVLPPRLELNGAVERANRTHTEEFYQVTPCSLEMKKLNRELRQWEKIYNTVRPHQSLGYLTPRQFLLLNSSQRKE